ncbi:MAG: hypothetical protein HGA45_05060 [Chloroflexales bacterium]|nr:hypothetical protein [Chloroflexales bacterium]
MALGGRPCTRTLAPGQVLQREARAPTLALPPGQAAYVHWEDAELVILGEIGIALHRLTGTFFAADVGLASAETTAHVGV